jgi:RsiW-degrading membrane proteinase PrsW (M82 family)
MAERVWRNYLRTKTRNPRFLWRMVIAILALGIFGGMIAQLWRFDPEDAGEMLAPPSEAVAAVERLESLADAGAWGDVWWGLREVVFQRMSHRGPLVLAALAGICWLIFCLQAAQVRGWRDSRLWLMLAAVALGGLSVWPTHFFSMWLERRLGLHETEDLVGGIRFFVLGVGLPEESAKLLCFVPLIPLLLWVRGDLIAMMTAGCVGLGFAFVENVSYFHGSLGTDAVGRYLTANPAHMTLTGLAGLALYRAVRDPKGWGPQALLVFGLMVLAHGLYDATIVIPAFGDLAILGSIIFALVVYQFFRELRELRPKRVEVVSLTATFLAGVSLVTAATFVYISSLVGFGPACDAMVMQVVSTSLMAYLFLREMPETMVTV